MLLRHSPNNAYYSRIVRSASIPNNMHLTLVLLAYAFLVDITVHSHRTTATQQEPVACPPLIALSTSEARHPAFPPLLVGAHFRSPDLPVVDLSAHPSVLG